MSFIDGLDGLLGIDEGQDTTDTTLTTVPGGTVNIDGTTSVQNPDGTVTISDTNGGSITIASTDNLLTDASAPLVGPRPRGTRIFLTVLLILIFFITFGAIGFYAVGLHNWGDAFYNAAMCASGAGPTQPMTTTGQKTYTAIYMLASGLLFISIAATLIDDLINAAIGGGN